MNLSDPLGDIMGTAAPFKFLFFFLVDLLGLCRGYNYGKTRAG